MILAASLLALVAMATAVPAAPDENWCCLPDKYEMSEVDIKQFGSGYMEVNRIYFDGTAKKSATIGSLLVPGQPSVFKFRNVIDYNLHKMFTIQPDNSCHSDDFTDAFAKPCVSKDWPVLASSYVGDQSVGEKFEVFHFNTGSANLTTVMDHNCVPIVQYIKGKYGRYDIDSSQFFSDYKAGNSDPAVYDVPAGC